MRIVMDKTKSGSFDGFTVSRYIKGNVYDSRADKPYYISETLARGFINKGFAHEQTWDEWNEKLNPLGFINAINATVSEMTEDEFQGGHNVD